MDSAQRHEAINQIERELMTAQGDHVARLDMLDGWHRADLDVLTEIYGADLLRASETSRGLVSSYEKLHQALESNEQYVCVAGIKKVLRDGCYGFGAKPVYDRYFNGCFLDRSKAEITLNYINDDVRPRVELSGSGFVIVPKQSLPTTESDVTFEVSSLGNDEILRQVASTNLDVIETSNDRRELGLRIVDRSQTGGRCENLGIWPLNWARNILE